MSKSLQELLSDKQKLEDQIKHQRKTEKPIVIKAIKEQIEMYQITSEELGFKPHSDTKASPVKTPAKYRDGELTWTGRGAKPTWIKEKIKNGENLDQYLIEKTDQTVRN